MAEYLIQDSTLTGIANAIRSKTGGSDAIAVDEMATAIEGIEGGGGDSPDSIFAIAHPNGFGVEAIPFKVGMTWTDFYNSTLNGAVIDLNYGTLYSKIYEIGEAQSPGYGYFDSETQTASYWNIRDSDGNLVNWSDTIQPLVFDTMSPIYQTRI